MPAHREFIAEPEPVAEPSPPESTASIYDRSSMPDDLLVMIPGQTAADFFERAPDKRFCEYFDGIVYMPSPVIDRHQQIVIFLTHILDAFRCERGSGVVLSGPAVLRLSEERCFEPDIFVLPVGVAPSRGVGDYIRQAVLVVEVLSPSNRSYDLNLKGSFYREAEVPEIWYVDDRDNVLIVDRRREGGYQTERYERGIVACSGIPGFWIDASWLWDDPANPRRCLEAILAGLPQIET